MLISPEDAAKKLAYDNARAAAIGITHLAQNWLGENDPLDPAIQALATLTVVRTYGLHGARPSAEGVRDGLRNLLGLRGPQALEAACAGLRMVIEQGLVDAEGLGTNDVRYVLLPAPSHPLTVIQKIHQRRHEAQRTDQGAKG